MGLYICEFEITPPEDATQMWGVWPFGLPGATEGASFDDAVAMAADWLLLTVEAAHEDGRVLPRQTLGQKPRHGGRVVAVAVEDDAQPDEVTPYEAAIIMALSEDRIQHYWKEGTLNGRVVEGKTYIDRQSLNVLMDMFEAEES